MIAFGSIFPSHASPGQRRVIGSVCHGYHVLNSQWTTRSPKGRIGTFTKSSMWRFMVASDGHPVQHLHTMTGGEVHLEVLESRDLTASDPVPEMACILPGRVHQRQITVDDGKGEVLLYATSWWDQDRYRELIKPEFENEPVWEVFRRSQTEIARSITAFHYGMNVQLETIFNRIGPFWGREYCFKQNRVPFAVFYEVFSPSLTKYIGDMTPPSDIDNIIASDRDPHIPPCKKDISMS